jgi:hypothetical protein
MKGERKTLDILGVIRFCYRKKPDHLAAVVDGCVREQSMAGVYSTDSVVLRNVKVVGVACRKGTASVGFKARVYGDGRSAVSLGNHAVTAIWEACHCRYAEPDADGLVLLDLDDAQLQTPAQPEHCWRRICFSTLEERHCECPCEDCIEAGIHHG